MALTGCATQEKTVTLNRTSYNRSLRALNSGNQRIFVVQKCRYTNFEALKLCNALSGHVCVSFIITFNKVYKNIKRRLEKLLNLYSLLEIDWREGGIAFSHPRTKETALERVECTFLL